jgi:hypothetical protein
VTIKSKFDSYDSAAVLFHDSIPTGESELTAESADNCRARNVLNETEALGVFEFIDRQYEFVEIMIIVSSYFWIQPPDGLLANRRIQPFEFQRSLASGFLLQYLGGSHGSIVSCSLSEGK